MDNCLLSVSQALQCYLVEPRDLVRFVNAPVAAASNPEKNDVGVLVFVVPLQSIVDCFDF